MQYLTVFGYVTWVSIKYIVPESGFVLLMAEYMLKDFT